MKRPRVIHFTAIETEEQLAIRASLGLGVKKRPENLDPLEGELPRTPWDSINLLFGHFFKIKLQAFDSSNQLIFEKSFDSDMFGSFDFKISKHQGKEIHHLKMFEIGHIENLDLLMGNFFPKKIENPKKIIISDFDRTLVDTRYHTTKEIYESLTRPLKDFPQIRPSIEKLKSFIKDGHIPFILTASPHFYEDAIRDWLYQNELFTTEIFLKDYRKIISPWYDFFRPKDLKAQGFYKLNHLINILLMTGIPDELVLMGDGLESDTLIYLALTSILFRKFEARSIWNLLKDNESFRLSNRQHSRFISKILQIDTMLHQKRNGPPPKVKIYIRCPMNFSTVAIKIKELKDLLPIVEFYQA